MRVRVFALTFVVMFLSFTSNHRSNSTPTIFDIDGAKRFVQEFQSTIINYANANDEDEADRKRIKLLTEFYNKESSNHCIDFPDNNSLEPISFEIYLDRIEDDYKYGLETNFEEPQLFNCEQILKSGERVFFFSMVKNTTYNGKKRRVEQIVELMDKGGSYRIKQVLTMEYFKLKNTYCKIRRDTIMPPSVLQDYKAKGDAFFDKRDFKNAKYYYQLCFESDRYNSSLEQLINTCDKKLTTTFLLEKSNDQIRIKDFMSAKTTIEEILKIEPKNIEAQKSLALITLELNKIQFEKNKTVADDYFNKNEFLAALQFYQLAETYNEQDTYIRDKIKKCQQYTNTQFIQSGIRNAKLMIKDGKYNDGFRQLQKFEFSGLLDGEAYYAMAFLIDDHRIKMKPKEKARRCEMCKEYILAGIRSDINRNVIFIPEESKCYMFWQNILKDKKKDCNTDNDSKR